MSNDPTFKAMRELVSANIAWREAKFHREKANELRGAVGAARRHDMDHEVREAYTRMLNAEKACLEIIHTAEKAAEGAAGEVA